MEINPCIDNGILNFILDREYTSLLYFVKNEYKDHSNKESANGILFILE